jgi:hypothetical protein
MAVFAGDFPNRMIGFFRYYYQLFEQNRSALGNLYQDQSMLTFEGQKFMGAAAIVQKLQGLQFGQCKVVLATQDFQVPESQ